MAPNTLARSRLARSAGWTRPAWYKAGPFSPVFFADGGDGGGDADPDDGGQGGDPEPKPADDWTPPTREEYDRLVADKAKASSEAANRRKWMRAAGLDPKTGNKLEPDDPEPEPATVKDDPPAGPSAAEVKRQIEKATAEAELRGLRKTKALVTGVNAALAEAGWNGQRLNSLMKLIDLDDVDLDDGEITGLSEQIDGIKQEWPEFFKRTRSATPANSGAGSGQNGAQAAKVDTADKKPPAPEPSNWAERLAAKTLRGA